LGCPPLSGDTSVDTLGVLIIFLRRYERKNSRRRGFIVEDCDLVQVAGVIPRDLRNRAYASLASEGVKFRHWLRRTMEEVFGEDGACDARQHAVSVQGQKEPVIQEVNSE
jgi:hypothetical protein